MGCAQDLPSDEVVCDDSECVDLLCHGRGPGANEVESHGGFDIAKTKLDVPSAGVFFPDGLGGAVQVGGGDHFGGGSEPFALEGQADVAHVNLLGEFLPLLLCDVRGTCTQGRFEPLGRVLFPALGKLPFACLMQLHDGIGLPRLKQGEVPRAAKGGVADQGIHCSDILHESSLKHAALMLSPCAVDRVDHRAATRIHQGHLLHHREPTTGLLVGWLWVLALILLCVTKLKTSAVHVEHTTSLCARKLAINGGKNPFMNRLHGGKGQPLPGLTKPAGLAGELALAQRHQRRVDLYQTRPQSPREHPLADHMPDRHRRTKPTLTLVRTPGNRFQGQGLLKYRWKLTRQPLYDRITSILKLLEGGFRAAPKSVVKTGKI